MLKKNGLIYISIDKNLALINSYITEISINILKEWVNQVSLYNIWAHEEDGNIICYLGKRNIYENVQDCNLCGCNNFVHIKYLESHEWTPVKRYYNDNVEFNLFENLPEKFELLKCSKCGLVFTNPRISDYVVNQFYDEYFNNKYKNYVHSYNDEFREQVFNNYIMDIRKYIPESGKFLDIGCASGLFLKVMGKLGYECYGIEVAESVGNQAKKYGEVYIGDVLENLNKIDNDYFDLVAMVDFIEHFQKPRETIELLNKKIRRKGFLFIETPNYYGGADEMSRHFYLFSDKTMKKLLIDNGFQIVLLKEISDAYNSKDNKIKGRFLRGLAQKI